MNAPSTWIGLRASLTLFLAGPWGIAGAQEKSAEPVDRIILFGFGPFAGRAENASWQSVRQFAGGDRIRSVEVPVVWGAPRGKLIEALKNDSGRVVLVGVGEGTPAHRLETIGFNRRGAIDDEAGRKPAEDAIEPGEADKFEIGPAAHPLADKLTARGFPTSLSRDAGRFLCNEMLYELLRLQDENPKVAAALFIHVPVLGSEADRDGKKVRVDRAYCADFGKALAESLAGIFPLKNPPDATR